MKVFRIRLAKKRGDLAFALADISDPEERRALRLAKASGVANATEEALAHFTPVWDFAAPRKVSIPTGWALFLPLGTEVCSEKMWGVLHSLSNSGVWHEIPSLSEPPPHARWGLLRNVSQADVLDIQKSKFDPLGALFDPVLNPNHGDVPPFFVASGTDTFFASEVGKKAMLDSGLTGFAFEEVTVK